MLIRNAEIYPSGQRADVVIDGTRIVHIGSVGDTYGTVIEANGSALLPGLHDHHIHLLSLAAARQSVPCGPPEILTEQQLRSRLHALNTQEGWLRGTGYHPSVAGDIDRIWLDRVLPNRPVRIQHCSGRLWLLNSCALDALDWQTHPPAGLELRNDQPTGRLYEGDHWLRHRLSSAIPSLREVSQLLASYGVTGVTDTSPGNNPVLWRHFADCRERGELYQTLRVMGDLELNNVNSQPGQQCGEYKIHLLESQFPDFDKVCSSIGRAHQAGRAVAIHCVSTAELVFALAALEQAGVLAGDRIEHASIVTPEQMQKIATVQLRVITQPHFIRERGDNYLKDVPQGEQPWLYRCHGFLEAGIPLAAGSDAPFGNPDPWLAMRAAVTRRTHEGEPLGEVEAITPEQALALFTSSPDQPGIRQKSLTPGADADLCLLDCSWSLARETLDSSHVRMTLIQGKCRFLR